MDCFKINWTGYYSLNEAKSCREAKKLGVYAVYRPIGGKKVLWYFGKATEIGARLDDHRKEWQQVLSQNQIGKLQVAIGVIEFLEGNQVSQKQLGHIESLYLNEYRPKRNNESTMKGYKGDSILIINTGKTGQFPKITVHDKPLLKLIRDNLAPRRSSSQLYPF